MPNTLDLEPLAEEILSRLTRNGRSQSPHLSRPALRMPQAYDWPGNLRQLENVLEQSAAASHDPSVWLPTPPECSPSGNTSVRPPLIQLIQPPVDDAPPTPVCCSSWRLPDMLLKRKCPDS